MAREPRSVLPAGLYIVATPIGNLGDITLRALETLRKVDALACEDTREAGKLCAVYDIDVRKLPYHDHNGAEMRPKILELLAAGKSVALISDAGMPLVSDPGYKLVLACLEAGHAVTCLPGPTAAVTALALSGLPADRFFFAGFLPPRTAARKSALAGLRAVPGTLIFYETAPRLADCLADIENTLGDRPCAVARELTKKFEETRRGSVSALRRHYAEKGPPKGEIVLLVGPSDAPAPVHADADIDAALKRLMDGGVSLRDAAARVAAETGLPRDAVYRRALALREKRP